MSFLDRQVGQARTRLTTNLLLQWLCFGILVAAGLWAVATLVVRAVGWDVPLWHGGWMAATLAAATAAAATLVVRPTALHAAVTLDQAAGLKERLSTALLIRRQGDPFARLAVEDAERTAGRVHVPSHVRYRAPQLWPWSVATTLTALLLTWLLPPLNLFAGEQEAERAVDRAAVEEEHRAIKTEVEQQLKKIEELAKDNTKLEDLAKDIGPLDMPAEPTMTPEDIRREAAKKIDDVRSKLERELKAAEQDGLKNTKRMLSQLDQPGQKAQDDKLAEALASGNFEGAKRALEDMAKQIEEAAKNAQDPEQQQRLAEMQKKLERLADQMSQLSDTQELQKELENKGGLSEADAKKLLEQLSQMDPKQLEKELQKRLGDKGLSQEQLEKLAQKIQQSQKAQQTCKNMAQSLSKAAQACQKCQGGSSAGNAASEAANALSDAASQMSDMEMSEQLMNELQAQISDLQNLRDGVCRGDMCPNRGGPGGQGPIGPQGGNYGRGIGARIGKERVAYDHTPTKAKSRFQSGAVIGRMLIDGPQVRGEVGAEEVASAAAEVRDALDSVERENIPRQYHNTLRTYFERLAGILREQQGGEKAGDQAGEKAPAEKEP